MLPSLPFSGLWKADPTYGLHCLGSPGLLAASWVPPMRPESQGKWGYLVPATSCFSILIPPLHFYSSCRPASCSPRTLAVPPPSLDPTPPAASLSPAPIHLFFTNSNHCHVPVRTGRTQPLSPPWSLSSMLSCVTFSTVLVSTNPKYLVHLLFSVI